VTSPAPSVTSRITRCFEELRRKGELGIVTFITAGDPSLEATERFVLALADAGADLIELGVPFSDPIADGPTIQRSSERALRAGTSLHSVLSLVSHLREKTEAPLVLFSYFNPVLQMGLEKFASESASAAVDGVLITDLTTEEGSDYRMILHAKGVETIFLASPTTNDDRLKLIAEASSGFLYLISRTGVTGAKDTLPEDLPALIRRARAVTSLPLAVGFGISLPGHVSILGGLADAAVVGSALVSEIERATSIGRASQAISERVRSLKQAASRGLSRREGQP